MGLGERGEEVGEGREGGCRWQMQYERRINKRKIRKIMDLEERKKRNEIKYKIVQVLF